MERTHGNEVWLSVVAALAALAALSGCTALAGDARLFTRENAPAAPKLEDLPLKESLSQHGVTWTFAEPARVGRFVNGEWYVVGPVTVTAVDPKTVRGDEVPEEEIGRQERRECPSKKWVRNGSMVNPPARREIAFDTAVRNYFRHERLATFPVQLKPGDVLLSSISLKAGETVERSMLHGSIEAKRKMWAKRESPETAMTKTVAVLTCLAKPVPADAFRPSFCDREQKIYLARDLRRELLPSVKRVERMPDIDEYARKFERVWFDVTQFNFGCPVENMPQYGREAGRLMSIAGLLLCCDFEPGEKEKLLTGMVQVGIDYWGVVRAGHPGWPAHGGHGSGRKFPITLAGILLGDEAMASPSKSYPNVEFGQDMHTMYDDTWTGARVAYAGHLGTENGEKRTGATGAYEHLHPSQWPENKVGENYRRCCTSNCWVGQALALRLMKAERYWAHDAFFDYVDRWMTPDDPEQLKELIQITGQEWYGSDWAKQGQCWDGFVEDMWAAYRPTLDAPMDGWKRKQ